MEEEKQYQVLALKYRPNNFSQLTGHQAMVRTLSNAILGNKLAHAFILTGIRGIGKTSTARIIAKVINCEHPEIVQDEDGHEIVEACGKCDSCRAIAECRHQDVLELDAASRTGVDDIREIIDTVSYLPVSAKYKVYIIDEVHMLSKNAFNALLKTLEEPPAHVKFIFATTEIQKVPITVLSRCQRFDLKRLTHQEVVSLLQGVLQAEGKEADEEVLALIATASEGSARDALSLLDQAISLGNYQANIDLQTVADMLGVIDRLRVYDLFSCIITNRVEEVLQAIDDFYRLSVDVKRLLQDLLSLTHKLTLAKTAPQFLSESPLIDSEKQRILELAERVSLGSMVRIWQALLNGTKEVNSSFNQKEALEMLLIKICYLSTLPSPAETLRHWQQEETAKPAGGLVAIAPEEIRGETSGMIIAADKANIENIEAGGMSEKFAEAVGNNTVGQNSEALAQELLQKFAGAEIIQD